MAKLAIKWANESDRVSKYPAVEKTFESFCRQNNLKTHEKKLARAMLNYSVAVQEIEGEQYLAAIKKAFAFIVGYVGANGVTDNDMEIIIGIKNEKAGN